MIWTGGVGAVVQGAVAPGAVVHGVLVHGAGGPLESALPGEWALLFLVLALIAVVGAGVLVATCVRHERVMLRRHAGRVARRMRERLPVAGDRHSLGP
jgi:hypothetical protein